MSYEQKTVVLKRLKSKIRAILAKDGRGKDKFFGHEGLYGWIERDEIGDEHEHKDG